MVKVDSQFVYIFSIGGKKDFIETQDLLSFVVIEEAGNVLPVWEIEFITKDKELLEVFHEGYDLEITYGKDEENLIDTKLIITSKQHDFLGVNQFAIKASGLYSCIEYITNPYTTITDKKSGIEVVIEQAKKYFPKPLPDANVTESKDEQYWIQPYITGKRFIDEVLLHSYDPSSFYGAGINSNGQFILRDFKKLITDKVDNYDYKFLKTDTIDDKTIPISGNYYLKSKSGFINCWVGYNRIKPIYTLQNDSMYFTSEEIKPLMAMTNALSRRININRGLPIGTSIANIHDKYFEAYIRNIAGLSLFSSESIEVSFPSIMNEISIYDLIHFSDSVAVGEGVEALEFPSGPYIVGLVSRVIQNSQLLTTCKLYRESMNSIKGDLY